MRYGQLQYYSDELNQWFRIVTFQKNVMDESIRQLNVILTFPIVSIPTYKIGNSLVDRLNTEKKKVDFFLQDLTNQTKRLRKAISIGDHEAFICDQQKNLRMKMKRHKLKFIRITDDCSAFVSSFFEFVEVPISA